MTIVTIVATSSTGVLLPVGGRWVLEVETTDDAGYLADAVVTATVTLPDNSTTSPTVEHVDAGRYRAVLVTALPGRYVARLSTSGDAVNFAAVVLAATTASGMPTPADVVTYLGETSHTEAEIGDALEAEAAAQASVCRIRAVYPADLREALLRRVARNLAMRGLPLAMPQGDADVAVGILPGRDPEVRRLEGPHRKLTVG